MYVYSIQIQICNVSMLVNNRVFPTYQQHKVGISANYFFTLVSFVKVIVVTLKFIF